MQGTLTYQALERVAPHKPGDISVVFDPKEKEYHLIEAKSTYGMGLDYLIDKKHLWDVQVQPWEVDSWQIVYQRVL